MSYISTTGHPLMAKSDGVTTLENHLLDCSKIACLIADNSPFDSDIRQRLKDDLIFCALAHDAGKIASGFQDVMYKTKTSWAPKRHEVLSTCFAATFPNVKEEQLFAILTHHRSIFRDAATTNEKALTHEQIIFKENLNSVSPVFQNMVSEWSDNLSEFFDMWNKICNLTGRTDFLLEKNPVISNIGLSYEWLSRSKRQGQISFVSTEKRKYASLLRGALISSDHLASAGIVSLPTPVRLKEYDLLSNSEIYPFQHRMKSIKRDAILRAPTGSGKTKASLLWAAVNQVENGRLFYVLPYTASINAMFLELRNIYGKENVGLLHHKSVSYLYKLQEEEQPVNYDAKLLADLAKETYYPIKTCTPHQLLKSALRGRGWEQSLLEFQGACFIFDEVHAYEPRILGLLLAMTRWLKPYGAKFIFISATMPEFLRRTITQYLPESPVFIEPNPKIPKDRKILEKKRHLLETWEGNILDQLDKIIQMYSTKKILIVCNHVSTAQSVYKHILEKIENNVLDVKSSLLIHSRFAHQDRTELENKIMAREKNKIMNEQPEILVSTQVIEVSLNLDYQVCITEPAPIDALVQRFGRVNRYGERDPEPVIVLTEQLNKNEIYPKWIIKKTLENLEPLRNSVLSEKDLITVSDKVYETGYTTEDTEIFNRMLNHPEINEFDENILAGTYRNWVEEVIEGTDQVIEVLPEIYYKKYVELYSNRKWIEASMLLVNISYSQYMVIDKKGYIETTLEDSKVPVITAPYSKKLGLKLNDLKVKDNDFFDRLI